MLIHVCVCAADSAADLRQRYRAGGGARVVEAPPELPAQISADELESLRPSACHATCPRRAFDADPGFRTCAVTSYVQRCLAERAGADDHSALVNDLSIMAECYSQYSALGARSQLGHQSVSVRRLGARKGGLTELAC